IQLADNLFHVLQKDGHNLYIKYVENSTGSYLFISGDPSDCNQLLVIKTPATNRKGQAEGCAQQRIDAQENWQLVPDDTVCTQSTHAGFTFFGHSVPNFTIFCQSTYRRGARYLSVGTTMDDTSYSSCRQTAGLHSKDNSDIPDILR